MKKLFFLVAFSLCLCAFSQVQEIKFPVSNDWSKDTVFALVYGPVMHLRGTLEKANNTPGNVISVSVPAALDPGYFFSLSANLFRPSTKELFNSGVEFRGAVMAYPDLPPAQAGDLLYFQGVVIKK